MCRLTKMLYLPDPDGPELTPNAIRARFEAYWRYLDSVEGIMPPAAWRFARADWHYDATRHECPHDAWVESVTVRETGAGPRSSVRCLAIDIVLLGAYQDGSLILQYSGVTSYSLIRRASERDTNGHGDWLLDEIVLADEKRVRHEVALAGRARWTIDCNEIEVSWRPRAN
jgi:hypothetical protein